jgi:hypothetical protein
VQVGLHALDAGDIADPVLDRLPFVLSGDLAVEEHHTLFDRHMYVREVE